MASNFGHDKSVEIRKYSQLPKGERPVIFYAGDGVSDLSAAREADLMFAKSAQGLCLSSLSLRRILGALAGLWRDSGGTLAGHDKSRLTSTALVTYCKTEGIPYTEFDDFSSIFSTVKAIVEGKTQLKDVVKNVK